MLDHNPFPAFFHFQGSKLDLEYLGWRGREDTLPDDRTYCFSLRNLSVCDKANDANESETVTDPSQCNDGKIAPRKEDLIALPGVKGVTISHYVSCCVRNSQITLGVDFVREIATLLGLKHPMKQSLR